MEINYEQFADLEWPPDIVLLPVFDRRELETEINEKREINKRPPINLSGKVCINYNSPFFRQDEINIHCVDLFFNYEPDFGWTDVTEEFDPWRRTCKLKVNFQRFKEIGIDQIRSENFIHKIHICESLTFFEDSFKMLNDDGKLILKYMDLIAYFKEALDNQISIKTLEQLEKKIFVQSDPSGLYYNKTLLTMNRIDYYLKKVGFKTVQKDEDNSDQFNVSIIAYKN